MNEARPRRLRATSALRNLVSESHVRVSGLVLPVFVAESINEPRPISSMPGVVNHTLDSVREVAAEAVALGLGGIMLFGVPEHRDATGAAALDPDGILTRAIRTVREEVGDGLVVMSDVCLDEFTDHGHCGLVDSEGNVDNDSTAALYARMAVLHAEAGAHMVGPSGMMDGQVAAIREALDNAGHQGVGIMAYTAKYASAFYGPFREAVDSSFAGNRRQYQQDPRNRREALRELELDLAEGADIVMVKPAMSYLDVLAEVAAASPVPVAAYQVSGEYAMVEAAAERGWVSREAVIDETLISISRAGADIILTYWAAEYARRNSGVTG